MGIAATTIKLALLYFYGCEGEALPMLRSGIAEKDHNLTQARLDSCRGRWQLSRRTTFVNSNSRLCNLVPYGSNFGDELGPAVARRLLELRHCSPVQVTSYNLKRCYPPEPRIFQVIGSKARRSTIERDALASWQQCKRYAEKKDREFVRSPHVCLLTVGSILENVKNYYPDDQRPPVVWGTGTHPRNYSTAAGRPLRVIATRGPLTAAHLRSQGFIFSRSAPLAFGDPGLLVPTLFPEVLGARAGHAEPRPHPSAAYCIVPHMEDPPVLFKDHLHVYWPRLDWRTMVRRLANCKFVIASSLHGIIVAEALHIPTRWLYLRQAYRFSPAKDKDARFKYNDYYASTNRSLDDFAVDVHDALRLGPKEAFDVDGLARRLLATFPYDLFASREQSL